MTYEPSLRTVYIGAVVLAMGCIAALGITALQYNASTINSPGSVRNTLALLFVSDQVLSGTLDSGVVSRAQMAKRAGELRELARDEPEQAARADSIWAMVHAGPGAPGYLDRMRRLVGEMQTAEQGLLAARERAGEDRRLARGKAIRLLLVAIGVMAGGLIVLNRYNVRRRRRAEKGLAATEQSFQLMVKNIQDYAIYIVDPAGHILTWNDGARHIKGYSESEVMGRHYSMFYTEEETEEGIPGDQLHAALREGGVEVEGWRKRKDGSVFWADNIMTPIFAADGTLSGFVKITKDVTEQKRLREATELALVQEREVSAVKSRFLSFASHEFKTPLSIILSSASLVEKYLGDQMGEKVRKHLGQIKSNVRNLKQLLDDFLSLDKIEVGATVNRPEEVDLAEFIDGVVENIRDTCKPGQAIRCSREGLSRATIDPHILLNILNNLLSNAIKYSPEGSPIELSVTCREGLLSVRVKDQGIGIPRDEIPRLFSQYFRATNTGDAVGTGLGMTIVKKYVDMLGGSIQVTSELDMGSEFTVVIPEGGLTPA